MESQQTIQCLIKLRLRIYINCNNKKLLCSISDTIGFQSGSSARALKSCGMFYGFLHSCEITEMQSKQSNT